MAGSWEGHATDYYNDHEPYCAAWLRNLAATEVIPPGTVDERDVRELQPDDLARYRQVHLFAGIGGWPLALRLAGWNQPCWTASLPCPSFSAAGKRGGVADERHLWPVVLPLVAGLRPPVIFGEQVEAAIQFGWLDGIFDDLEQLGYACGAAVLPACGVGAPHIRQRLYWVAVRLDDAADARIGKPRPSESGSDWENDGIPRASGTTGATGWLALAAGARCDDSRKYGVGQPLLSARSQQRGPDGWLAFPEPQQHGRGQSGPRGRIESADGGAVGGLEQSTGDGRGEGRSQPERGSAEPRCTTGGLGDAESARLEAFSWDAGSPQGATGRTGKHDGHSAWAASTAIYCADGRWRRVPLEPRLQPLADAWPNLSRVAVLRAAGNAIVPQVAAEFIRAFLECENINSDGVRNGR